MDIIRVPIGYLLDWIYQIVNNYGLALILFTFVVKILLLPLGLKQQKSMTKMQKLQPELTKLQEKYKNDQNLLGQETMKLYKKHGVSPMGGCLPLLIQLPILFALYRVIQQPLTYVSHLDANTIDTLAKGCLDALEGVNGYMRQIVIAKEEGLINFDFFGLDLSQNPSFAKWATLIIPVLSGLTTYLSTKVTQWINKKPEAKKDEPPKVQRVLSPEPKKSNQPNSAEGMTKTMGVIMPFFTLWITYTLPMSMGMYWIASNVFSIGQTLLLNGYYSKKFADELEQSENERLEKQSRLHGSKKNRRK